MSLALLVAAVATLSGPPPTLVRYEILESSRAVTPAGSRELALKGTVVTAGGKARWETPGSRLPGVAARAALFDGANLFLLDPDASVVSPATRQEFDELFQAPAGPPGMATAGMKDLVASVTGDGAGKLPDGAPTSRWSVSCAYTLVSTQPGRVVRLRHEVRGTVESLEGGGLTPTPFDDLLRLFRVRGEAREALELELRKVTGLPVRVRLEATSEAVVEAAGADASAGARRPVKSTTTTTRTVSIRERRPLTKDDAELFSVPDSYRTVPFERLKSGGTPQP